MRRKQAKALRRAAEALTVGKPNKEYRAIVGGRMHNSTCVLKETCTRAVYKKLKARFKTGDYQ